MAAWPIKFTEGFKPGKKHPLPIDLSTENKKAKRSAYEKERRPGRSFNQKWKDGRHWLSYNESENVMKCTVCTEHAHLTNSQVKLEHKHLKI
jgi:hypothetical protein